MMRTACRKEVGQEKECIVRFDTVYEPGQVEVVAYTDGTESGRDVILTAGDNVHIEAAADRACIPADGSDVCFVEIELKDCRGILNPQADKEVSIAVEGAGMLLGYGSADPDTEECYCDCTARAFEGRLRAVIRGNGAEGEIAVRLSAEGCEEKTIRINAE